MFTAFLTISVQETIINDIISPAVMLATLLIFGGIAHSADMKAVASATSQNIKAVDPIVVSAQRFEQIQSYQVMVRSSSPQDGNKVIRYSYRKPGYVRMDFTEPHSGAVLIFNPSSGRVKLWPFGVGKFPVLNLSPTDSLIQDGSGHRVDQSDIGVLLSNIRKLQHNGTTTTLGEEILSGKPTEHISVVGPDGMTVDAVHRYDVWFDKYYGFPAKVVSYAPHGKLLETVFMDAMVVNIHFPTDFFTP